VHLQSAEDVVIVEGRAPSVPPGDLRAAVVEAYTARYGGDWHDGWAWFALEADRALTWSADDIRNTAVRFDFSREP
jgi:hypothetical protein